MQDWNTYRESLIKNVGTFGEHNPDVLKGLGVMDQAAVKRGHLTPKIHELIALAVAVTTRCDGCIATHTKKAAEHGASMDEIAEALGVAITLNAGAALTYSVRVLEAYEQLPAHA